MTSRIATTLRGLRAGPAGRLWVLMFTQFVDMVGALMVIPLLPFYARDLGASAFELTVIVASFSAAQLLSAPLWGRVSDRYGRRPVLLSGLAASVVGYTIFAFADSVWLLLLSRVVQGAGGGTTGVIQAYVADSVEPRHRARALGWLSAAGNVGVVIGPVLGSASTVLGRPAPGLLAATLAAVNFVFVRAYLSESHDVAARARSARAPKPLAAVLHVLRRPNAAASGLIWIYAIAIGAFYGITALLTLFLIDQFGISEREIGIFFMYIGGLNVLFRLVVLGPVVDRLGEIRTWRLGAALLALGLLVTPLTRPVPLPGLLAFLPLALAVALMPLGTTLTFPSVTALLSQVVGQHERGLFMGVQQTFGSIARVVYPPLAGLAWDHLGHAVPFITSAALVASTIVLGRRQTREAHDAAAVELAATGEHPAIVD